MNKLLIMGNMTRDVELSYANSGTAIGNFGIAHNYKYGEREETCFADCVAFGKKAEFIQRNFTKGKKILVEGRLSLDQWDAQDGTKRSKHKIVVSEVYFVGGNADRPTGYQEPNASAPETYQPPSTPPDDDCPF